MDFSLTAIQLKQQEEIREWSKSVLDAGLTEREKQRQFNSGGWQKSVEKGLPGLIIPDSFGGRQLDPVSLTATLEALGNGSQDNGFNFALNAHLWGCVHPINVFGNDRQKQKYLSLLASGECIGALAASEVDAGSDIFSLKCTADKKQDKYVLNGGKVFVTNAPVAGLFLVLAVTDFSRGAIGGLSAFLIQKDAPGFRIGANLEKMGLHTAAMSEVFLEEVVVSIDDRLGAEGAGFAIFNSIMEWERGFIMSTAVGAMERQIANCAAYAKQRQQFQQPIGKFQAVADMLVEMRLQWETSRLFLYKFAWLKAQKLSAIPEAAMTKLTISEAWIKLSEAAQQIHGGYGYLAETGVERDLRDALGSRFYSGTSNLQKQIIARMMNL